jgi:hypothetical protein
MAQTQNASESLVQEWCNGFFGAKTVVQKTQFWDYI